jgi:hypothetical protein
MRPVLPHSEILVSGSSEKVRCRNCGSGNVKKMLSAPAAFSAGPRERIPGPGDTACCGSSMGLHYKLRSEFQARCSLLYPTTSRNVSGKFMVRVPPEVYHHLAIQAAESGLSLNRFTSSRLNQ